jgi:hypothetical protein
VKKPESPPNSEHLTDLLLPYVDGSLSPVQRQMVEEHLKGCPECSSEANEIRETVTLLGHHKEAFCPEPWELYEFVKYGHDANGMIRSHLDRCSTCLEISRDIVPGTSAEQMPRHVSVRLKERLRAVYRTKRDDVLSTESLLDRLYRRFRFPAVAMGVAAAAVLAMVLLHSPDMPQSVIALSGVTWERAPKPKAIQATAGSAAIALVLKDFDPPLPREKIDALYQALAPSMDVYERFHVVPPATVKDAVDSRDKRITDTMQLVERLGKKLHLAAALVVTVTARPKGATVELELVDTASGQIKARKTEDNIPEADLERKLRDSALSMLLTAGTSP